MVKPALKRLGFSPSGKCILDIGCGVGRLFPGFAELFGEIWGIDVSPEMIAQGRKLCPVSQGRLLLGSGGDLKGIEGSSVDYCFSYIVFQHFPNAGILWRYLDEVHMVLKPGGAVQLHFRSSEPLSLKKRVERILPASLRPVAGAC